MQPTSNADGADGSAAEWNIYFYQPPKEKLVSKPAARVGDNHLCPQMDGPKPHVGGPVAPPGESQVLIGGLPAARLGDVAVCAGPPDMIARGNPMVLIGGKPAAREGDITVHGGVIAGGEPNVLIGTTFNTTVAGSSVVRVGEGTHYLELEMVDKRGDPVPAEFVEITLPDGRTQRAAMDENGTIRIEGLEQTGNAQVTFPDLDRDAWKKA